MFDDLGDVIKKAHVQHPIGFVQHQRIERVQLQIAALQMIHHAPWRANRDMRAVLQRDALTAQGHAAAQGHDFDIFFGARQAANFDGDLIGQLACGAQHQRLHRKTARVQVSQQGQSKGSGFAAAGFGLGNNVFAEQGGGQGRRLNWGHLQIAQLLQVFDNGRVQRQAGKAGAGRCGGFSRLGFRCVHVLIVTFVDGLADASATKPSCSCYPCIVIHPKRPPHEYRPDCVPRPAGCIGTV